LKNFSDFFLNLSQQIIPNLPKILAPKVLNLKAFVPAHPRPSSNAKLQIHRCEALGG